MYILLSLYGLAIIGWALLHVLIDVKYFVQTVVAKACSD